MTALSFPNRRTPYQAPAPAAAALLSKTEGAMRSLSESLVRDLPLLMHGSGDVVPSRVDAASTTLLAELTCRYIYDLVDAAVDAHDILTDGAGGIRPPAPFFSKKRSARCCDEEDWDSPLPEPNKRNEGSPAPQSDDAGEWRGVEGVNLYEHRTRKPYTSVPTTIGTQCFVFPICHDGALYGRVMEVQAARRNLAPLMLDPVLMECVRDEGKSVLAENMFGWIGTNNSNNINRSSDHQEDDDDDEAEDDGKISGPGRTAANDEAKNSRQQQQQEEERGTMSNNERMEAAGRMCLEPKWPGLDDILPIHRGRRNENDEDCDYHDEDHDDGRNSSYDVDS